ncbi:VC2046/SO_2500 family protein [Paraglaciecola chathamensis]|uniref:Uncharacterized protein n=2 Tax=Paraglaciecola chathamensis TaxID=368405 RepID=A0A8H9IC65_9ALTE|nr:MULTISPECIES: VC2046/SO_2500 family protein [Paraglaciecola]GAC10393.1 hypothetical protein GCHA_2446 [Paraglaciecola chathamensis S18K6]GGZ47139.1 hypothetical protein GCM10011274_00950 [Paraglaciecola oceanifecundans]
MQETQATQNKQAVNQAALDLEFSGALNRASQQGEKFALLLSMLQQDILARPRIGPVNAEASWPEDEVTSYYPESHLQALAQDWLLADTTTEILHGDGIRNAQLWLAMHPQPLSLHNDAFHIDDEIFENSDTYTQTRYANRYAEHRSDLNNEIKVDETGIFDLLEEIGLQMQA